MRKFTHRFQVHASLETVASFHSDSKALKKLTPPPLFISFNNVEPLAESSVADFTMWLTLPILFAFRAHQTRKALES
jgi:ligand-binding SRPBCC domain-containing protein